MTALHYAVLYEHFDCMRMLVEAGAYVNSFNSSLELPIDFLSSENHSEEIAYLKAHGSFSQGRTALHFHAYYGNIFEMNAILEREPESINASDNDGRPPIFYAEAKNSFSNFNSGGCEPLINGL